MPVHHNFYSAYFSLLTLPGLHYLITRYGSRLLKRDAFDRAFDSRAWDDHGYYPELKSTVEKYAKGGSILELGTGTGKLAQAVDPASYDHYLGVDISDFAIEKARQLQSTNPKLHFEQADMLKFEPQEKFSVILWSESLYYIPPSQCEDVLKKYSQYLTEDGVQIIALSESLLVRYASTIEVIRKNLEVLADCYIQGSGFEMIVCR